MKGTKRMKTPLALRVHEDVAVRHERLLLHADACRQSAVRLNSKPLFVRPLKLDCTLITFSTWKCGLPAEFIDGDQMTLQELMSLKRMQHTTLDGDHHNRHF